MTQQRSRDADPQVEEGRPPAARDSARQSWQPPAPDHARLDAICAEVDAQRFVGLSALVHAAIREVDQTGHRRSGNRWP
jgi:hypothetical protein